MEEEKVNIFLILGAGSHGGLLLVFVGTLIELVLNQMGTEVSVPFSTFLAHFSTFRAGAEESNLAVATLPRITFSCLHTGCTRHIK